MPKIVKAKAAPMKKPANKKAPKKKVARRSKRPVGRIGIPRPPVERQKINMNVKARTKAKLVSKARTLGCTMTDIVDALVLTGKLPNKKPKPAAKRKAPAKRKAKAKAKK